MQTCPHKTDTWMQQNGKRRKGVVFVNRRGTHIKKPKISILLKNGVKWSSAEHNTKLKYFEYYPAQSHCAIAVEYVEIVN